jgi:hypothetical protein
MSGSNYFFPFHFKKEDSLRILREFYRYRTKDALEQKFIVMDVNN